MVDKQARTQLGGRVDLNAGEEAAEMRDEPRGGEPAVPPQRVGDPVQMFFPASMAVTGTVDGLAFVGTITVGTPGPGIIQAGAPKVRA